MKILNVTQALYLQYVFIIFCVVQLKRLQLFPWLLTKKCTGCNGYAKSLWITNSCFVVLTKLSKNDAF